MSVGNIVEFYMKDVVKGLNQPDSYEDTSMFAGVVLKTNTENAIISFTEYEKISVPLNALKRPRGSPYTSSRHVTIGQKVQVHWTPKSKNIVTGWWDATIVKRISKNKCMVEYSTKFDGYKDSETVHISCIRPMLKKKRKRI